MAHSKPATPAPQAAVLTEVKYSLPDLLREVQQERSVAGLAMEKLDQVEITKLFPKRTRRGDKNRE